MADERSNERFGSPGQHLISLRDEDLRFWSAALGCTVEDLREAVDMAGPSPNDVMEFLASTRW